MKVDSLKTVHGGINLTENFKITYFQINPPAGDLPNARRLSITRAVSIVLQY
jgi:hypothetical protein